MTLIYTIRVPLDVDRVASLSCSEPFLARLDALRGSAGFKYRELERTDTRVSFEVDSTEHEWGIFGPDKTKTLIARCRYEWDRPNRLVTWRYEHAAKRYTVRMSGRCSFLAIGAETDVRHELTLEASAPVIGKIVERFVVKETQRCYEAAYRELLERR